MITPDKRVRAAESSGQSSKLHGEFRLGLTSGLVTVAAAATATAGHMFAMRNPSTTTKINLRYLAGSFITSTGFGALQPMGYDLIVGRTWTAAYTGGTAIDVGSTVTTTNKVRVNQDTSIITANNCRMCTTAGLTAGGTPTLDANPVAVKFGLGSTAIGVQFDFTLWDARDDQAQHCRSPLTLGPDEGIFVRNVILMGATGVGYLSLNLEWDEVTV